MLFAEVVTIKILELEQPFKTKSDFEGIHMRAATVSFVILKYSK
jgi:hypothetical protein